MHSKLKKEWGGRKKRYAKTVTETKAIQFMEQSEQAVQLQPSVDTPIQQLQQVFIIKQKEISQKKKIKNKKYMKNKKNLSNKNRT